MTLTVLDDLLQGSEQWHDQRRGIVTASVVGQLISTRALTGIDYPCPECAASAQAPCRSKVRKAGEEATPIKTLHSHRVDMVRALPMPPVLEVARSDYSRSLTAQLVAERITGYTDPTFQSDDMMRGVNEEPRARALYSERYAEARESGFMLRVEDDWRLGYSPDGLVGDVGLIEVKAPRAKKHLATILSGEVPPEHMPQIQAGLLVSGREWLDFISFCGGMPMWVRRVHPDPKWFDAITEAVEEFETTAAQMVADYEAAVEGLPATERIDYFQDVVI